MTAPGTPRYTILVSIASLLIGCSESNEVVKSGDLPDSSAVESSTTVDAVVDLPFPQSSPDVTSESAVPAAPTEDRGLVETSPSKPKREPIYLEEANGKELASSHGPDGNIGYPYQPNEISHFITMLRDSRKNLTDGQLETIAADLNAFREQREAKTQ